ncbi:MAG: hypothetical protein R3F54_17595 [Alphaproteobacteria bacterium]
MTPRRILLSIALLTAFWPALLQAQSGRGAAPADNSFDIGVIIDNRPLPQSDAARADIDALFTMLDRQMFFEHIMLFERPTIDVICDVFGCPQTIEPPSPFPPLLWQITRESEARLFVYYIGDGRVEGVERQLLFLRRDTSPNRDVVGFPVDWLHRELEEASPQSAVVMLDTSFAPMRLTCAGDEAELEAALSSIRRTYQTIARDRWRAAGTLELSATTPVQAPLCDRFDQMLEGMQQPLFTKYLLKGIIDGAADREPYGDEDRLIDLGELTGYLDDQIDRAARFQWGRSQHVRAVGASSKVLASVDPRSLRARNAALLERRHRPPEIAEDEEEAQDDEAPAAAATRDDEPEPPKAEQRFLDLTTRCRNDPSADGCHPCVLDPGGLACAERCQESADSDLCAPYLTSAMNDAEGGREGSPEGGGVIAVVVDETPDDAGDPSASCRLAIKHVSPYASVLVERIRGDTAPVCAWAADRSRLELGPFAKLFTPVAWRLGRSTVQDAVLCLLDCERRAAPAESPAADPFDPPASQPTALPLQQPRQALVTTPENMPEPHAFHREICDQLGEPLPPYIGLPRWMPGTLLVSEGLRTVYGCQLPETPPLLPVPIVVAIEPPPAAPPLPAQDQTPLAGEIDDRLGDLPSYSADIGEGTDGAAPLPVTDLADATPPTESDLAAEPPPDENQEVEVITVEQPLAVTTSKVRWLQTALTVDNYNPGPIDGVLGPKTMAAVGSWRRDNDRGGQAGALTEAEFRAIVEDFAHQFGQMHERAQSF